MQEVFSKAKGGIISLNMGGSVLPKGIEMDLRGGGFIPMGSMEKADDVPARVSKNEFVIQRLPHLHIWNLQGID